MTVKQYFRDFLQKCIQNNLPLISSLVRKSFKFVNFRHTHEYLHLFNTSHVHFEKSIFLIYMLKSQFFFEP